MIDEILTTTSSLDPEKVQYAREAINDVIIQNFDILLKKALIKEYNGTYYSIEILQQVKEYFVNKNKINAKLMEYYDTISSNIKPEDTMDLVHLYSEMDVEIKNLDIETILGKTFSNIEDPNLQWVICRVVKEMLQDQQLSPDKMQIYGSGWYSKTIKIGDYVFKVGDVRVSTKIKNDKRIIQPLFRREIGDNDEKIFIEIQNVVDKNWYKGLTEEQIKEELYKVYSQMRDRGNRWTDIKKENVGRLLKPNTGIYNINGQELKGADEANGFIETENKEQVDILDAGELVVIDTDYIFDVQQERISSSNCSMYKKFEKRYLEEKEIGIANKVDKEPALLTSVVEVSKSVVTSKDIQTVSQFIVNKNNGKNIQNDMKKHIKEDGR